MRVKKQDFLLWIVAFCGTLLLGVLKGIALAVVLSLVIVIYESVRPQITILWRIPGTTIYRPLKQENNGVFIPNVFIARIGSSMYFANASFIKDVLMAYIQDLEKVNQTEYIVLEMTPVVSVDSTAVHVLQDVVNAFRARGIQIAFAMVGNRVEKTMRKANLKEFIGDQWFFPTVNEAVLFCLKHQQAKKFRSSEPAGSEMSSASSNPVHPGDEVGFSNDIHHACTAIFINLVKDVPMLLSAIANTFKQNQISVSRAQIEAMGDDEGSLEDHGAKHTYFVRSMRHAGKLLHWEISALREELVLVIMNHRQTSTGPLLGEVHDMANARIKALEAALERERVDNLKIKECLAAQSQRIEAKSLQDHQDPMTRPVLEGSEDSTAMETSSSSTPGLEIRIETRTVSV